MSVIAYVVSHLKRGLDFSFSKHFIFFRLFPFNFDIDFYYRTIYEDMLDRERNDERHSLTIISKVRRCRGRLC